MCGIAGYFCKEGTAKFDSDKYLNLMAKKLHHRGPDAGGIWTNEEAKVGFAFRRLAIQDLSKNGMQPMHSENNRFVIIFNGEIYNHQDLRAEIGKHFEWRSSSDTETILEAFSLWGFKKTLNKIEGMFSLCLFDKEKNYIYFAIDRFGEKPLYIAETNENFFFASELKAVNSLPISNFELDTESVILYSRYNYIPTPKTIFKDVFKLEGGTFLSMDLNAKKKIFNKGKYWSLEQNIKNRTSNKYSSFTDARNEIDLQIQKSVKKQMISDVPIGCLLSGGIDSSLITAVAAKQSTQKIRSFSMGFEDKSFDESAHAKRIASFLGTDHTEYIVSLEDAKNLIPRIVETYDEPFSDSSQIPTLLLADCVSKSVKVALSGDAGDELFGGYNRYRFIEKIDKFSINTPNIVRNFTTSFLSKLNLNNRAERMQNLFVHSSKRIPQLQEKLDKAISMFKEKNKDDMYQRSLRTFTLKDDLFHKDIKIEEPCVKLPDLESFTERMMCADTMNYLPNDILVKVDRAAMQYSLETRIPFLDPDLVTAAWSLPMKFKINKGKGKYILREILKNYVPESMFEKPKKGFNVPLDSWFRLSLKEWAYDTLSEHSIKSQKIFNYQFINRLLKDHSSEKKNNGSKIWNLVVMQTWLNKHFN